MKKRIILFVLLLLTAVYAFAYRYMEDSATLRGCYIYVRICYPDSNFKRQASMDLDELMDRYCSWADPFFLETQYSVYYCKDGDYKISYLSWRKKNVDGYLSGVSVAKRDRHGNWNIDIFSESYSDYQKGQDTYKSLCNKYAKML
ncbi:MAG: hypothetical protein IKZ86_06430 [Spirochaetaceae bacterium]|nr:hypothetical protein [Spirochaetaceae bacterium]